MNLDFITTVLKHNSRRYDLTQLLHGVVKNVQIVDIELNTQGNFKLLFHFKGKWEGYDIDDVIQIYRSESNEIDLMQIHYSLLYLEKYHKQGGRNTTPNQPTFVVPDSNRRRTSEE